MSVRIAHLNGDSSFLLVFSPPYAPENNPHGIFPGSFTVLIDPWIANGPSKVFSSKFAYTTRIIPSCIQSLQELPDPDLIIISQDKPDHCHRETLEQLPSDTSADIFAPPSAAKRIRSWRHFDSDQVHALPRYDERFEDSVIRIPVPAISTFGSAGEVTVSFLGSKVDLTGLHNGIGITYRPPSSVLSASASYISLPQPADPLTPPSTPPASHESSRTTSLSSSIYRHFSRSSISLSRPRSQHSPSSLNPMSLGPREKAISVLYSPHGLPYSLVKPFATNHLLSESALPLTALLHSFDRITNPWYLGGEVNKGSRGGLEIAKGLSARCWIGAHDEDKRNSGFSTRQLKTEKLERDLIRRMLEEDDFPETAGYRRTKLRVKRTTTALVELETGQAYFVPPR